MLAARFHAAGRSLSLDDVPVPEPGPDEVRVRVVASVGNTLAELEAAVALAHAGQLSPPVAGTLPLSQVNEALGRLRAGEVIGRMVLHPQR